MAYRENTFYVIGISKLLDNGVLQFVPRISADHCDQTVLKCGRNLFNGIAKETCKSGSISKQSQCEVVPAKICACKSREQLMFHKLQLNDLLDLMTNVITAHSTADVISDYTILVKKA